MAFADLSGASAAVVIQGETGTGKEVIARAIQFETCGWAGILFRPSLRKFVILRNLGNLTLISLQFFNEMPLAATLLFFGSERLGRSAGSSARLGPVHRKGLDVLKIQRSANRATLIALSGRMETEHMVELEKLLEAEPPGRRIVLDLKHLTLAGQTEVDFFARWEEHGVTLANCAPYIREWITKQRNGKQSNDF
jgi:hypothetical protein